MDNQAESIKTKTPSEENMQPSTIMQNVYPVFSSMAMLAGMGLVSAIKQ